MHAVAYRTTGIEEIERIRPLWEQLNAHHHAKASRFRSCYERMTFEDRKSWFCWLHETGEVRVDLALDQGSGRFIGYCVSSVTAKKIGEIESLFVDPGYRSAGTGTTLVTRGLAWMDDRGALRKRVSVADGNEDSWAFYKRFGFYPRMTVLEQADDSDTGTPGDRNP